MKALLLLLGLITAGAAAYGRVRGSVYSKGGPYSRQAQPGPYWLSIAVYLAWSCMMFYFGLLGRSGS